MPDEPIAEKPDAPAYASPEHGTLAWSWARQLLQDARNYWLATVRPDGRPHMMPIWCVWHDNALYFSTDPSSRKARNFLLNAEVAVSTDGAGASVVVEGAVSIVGAYEQRVRVAEAYAAKYGWPMRATENGVAFEDMETPLYVVTPRIAIGVTDDEVSKLTRWRFV
jgi:nitroimidazol reductase NimA-like FMN-containing flavoprotein (pyridoxamine 5'-phosphate oxidase superfamily)